MGIIHTTGPNFSKLAGKYGPLVTALRELTARTPPGHRGKDMIAAQLDASQERFAMIGHGHHDHSGASQQDDAQPGSL